MERKLASIRRIKDIQPIEGADLIECVTVDGWQLVGKKGEFQVGALCVYFEIDSFLPILPVFEFLRKSCYRKMGQIEGFRLKTIKLRGQISQGLALPIEILKQFTLDDPQWMNALSVGLDVTDLLGVLKYEPPLNDALTVQGQTKGNFPSFIKKTDQERIQNCFDQYAQRYANMRFEVTMKLDGSSCTLFYAASLRDTDQAFGACSRNYELKIDETDENAFMMVARKIRPLIESYCQQSQRDLAFQGELMGPKIQGNREKLAEPTFFLFDIYDIQSASYLSPKERKQIFQDAHLDQVCRHVPILDEDFAFFEKFKKVDQALFYVDIPSIVDPIAEGCVFKSISDPNVSFKVINNRFLLKSEI